MLSHALVSQISSLNSRDTESHQAYAAEILWTTIVGTFAVSQPELLQFSSGFNLPCPQGFRLRDVSGAIPKYFQWC